MTNNPLRDVSEEKRQKQKKKKKKKSDLSPMVINGQLFREPKIDEKLNIVTD